MDRVNDHLNPTRTIGNAHDNPYWHIRLEL